MARHLRLLGRDLILRTPSAWCAAVFALGLVGSACGSDSEHPPPAGTTGGSSGEDGSGGKGTGAKGSGGRGSGGRAGASGSAGALADGGGASANAGGTGGRGDRDGGAAGDSGLGGTDGVDGGGGTGGFGPLPDGGFAGLAVCVTSENLEMERMSFGRRNPADPAVDRFGAVSVDELSIAYTSSKGDLYVADRPMNTGPFMELGKLNKTALAVDRAAMSPTGTLVMAVPEDRTTLAEFTRDSRSDAFVEIEPNDLGGLRLVFEGGGLISEPVLGSDKESLFFLITPPGQAPILYESRWSDADIAWGQPMGLRNPEFESQDETHRRRPTGASADGLTLFFYDEVKQVERAAWRASPTGPFVYFEDIGDFPDAAPNSSCGLLFYTGTDTDGTGLFTAG